MQDHYLQVLGEKLGIRYEIMDVQYRQFAKNEGKFILQQNTRKTEKKYEIDRELLVAALFYQDFISQFVETHDRRANIRELIGYIISHLPESTISQAAKDESNHEKLLELQPQKALQFFSV